MFTLMGDGWAAMKADILKILEIETWISGLERFLKYSKYSIYYTLYYILYYNTSKTTTAHSSVESIPF